MDAFLQEMICKRRIVIQQGALTPEVISPRTKKQMKKKIKTISMRNQSSFHLLIIKI
jgi:hypothetical protein